MHYLNLNIISSTPLYRQLVDQIEHAIQSGVLQHHDLLPSESDIQKTFFISPIVVKKAYQILAEKHFVRSIRGKGTVVLNRPMLRLDYLMLTEHNASIFKHYMHPIVTTTEEFKEPYTLWFQRVDTSSLWIQKRIGMYQGFPTYYQEVYMLYQGVKKASLEKLASQSLSHLLMTFYPNTTLQNEHFYHPQLADGALASLLQVELRSPLHHARSYLYDGETLVGIILHYLPAEYVTLIRRTEE
jgi:DNA-binding GntR family transcriptional regulator